VPKKYSFKTDIQTISMEMEHYILCRTLGLLSLSNSFALEPFSVYPRQELLQHKNTKSLYPNLEKKN